MGPFYLLGPGVIAIKNGFGRKGARRLVRGGFMAGLGAVFWGGIFYAFYRALAYFRETELIGDLLAYRLLELVFLTFFSVLFISNVINSLSTFYLSDEMSLVLTTPATKRQVYLYKYVETLAGSSWMVALFGMPVFLSYGLVYSPAPAFYPAAAGVFLAFMLLPAPLGMAMTMFLVRVFPAKRTKDIVLFLMLVIVVMLYFLIRFMQPEKLMDPEAFSEAAGYIASMQGASNQLLPSYWAANTLWPLLSGGEVRPFWPAMLASTAAAFYVLGYWVFAGIFYAGYSRAQEGGRYRTYGMLPTGSILERLAGAADTPGKALVIKDIKTFFRDTTQWSQLFLLGALVVVYIYNFKVLPLERFPFATFFLENFISFLNLGLAGFVIAAVAVRFVFPAVSLEGGAFWILKASPLGLKKFIWAKFWSAWIPLFVLAEALVLVSNHYLNAGAFMTALSAGAIFFMTFGITGLGVGLGAVYPRFHYENAAQISAGYGAVVYMLFAAIYIGVVVLLLAWPVYLYFTAHYMNIPQGALEMIFTAGCFAGVLIINAVACIVPMRMGLVSLESLEV